MLDREIRGVVDHVEVPESAPGPIAVSMAALHGMAAEVLGAAIQERREDLGALLQLDRDLYEWERRLAHKPEGPQLTEARRHLGWAIYTATTGLYSLAYSALRVTLELSFAAVHFSANELHRRRWVGDRADFSWSKAIDADEGVLARGFLVEFNRLAADEAGQFASRAAESYRRCSQFMHGKLAATQTVPKQLTYSADVLDDWIKTGRKVGEAVLFLLYARYGEELLKDDPEGRLAETLEHTMGHLRCVRIDLGLPVEGH